MQSDIVCQTFEKHPHCLLGTPHRFILVVNLDTLLLPFNLEDQKLSCTISYFSAFSHIHSISFAIIVFGIGFHHINFYILNNSFFISLWVSLPNEILRSQSYEIVPKTPNFA